MSTNNLTLHPSLEVISIDEHRIQLLAVSDALTVDDNEQHVRTLIGLCDGTRTERQIRDSLNRRMDGGEALVEFLKSRSFIIDTKLPSPDDFLNHLDYVSRRSRAHSDDRRHGLINKSLQIALHGRGHLFQATTAALTTLGHDVRFNVSECGDDACDIAVALGDRLDQERFRDLNRRFVERSPISLFAAIDRYRSRIGPLVIPGESACFECHHHRLRAHLQFTDEFDARARQSRDDDDSTHRPWLLARAASTTIAATVMGFVFENSRLGRPNLIVEQNFLTNEIGSHTLLKLPRCPACGPASGDSLQSAIDEPEFRP